MSFRVSMMKCKVSVNQINIKAELTAYWKQQAELDRLLLDTENSYAKIYESVKTLLTVVKKQEKSLSFK